MRAFATPHCHSAASLDTASTAEEFAKWEAEHESGALTVTDHGTLGGARKIYDLANGKKYKGKLTPILGLEAYFRDDDCPVLPEYGVSKTTMYRKPGESYYLTAEAWSELKDENNKNLYEPFLTNYEYQKYFHLTMHFRDQAAYETCARLLSFADARAEQHGSERKPLFGWKELEELGAQNVDFMSSCMIGMVQRHLAFGGRYDLAEAYYKRLRAMARPGQFYVEMFPHVCDRDWSAKVTVELEDGSKMDFRPWTKLRTDRKYGKGEGVKAEQLADRFRDSNDHGRLCAVMKMRKWEEIEKPLTIKSVRRVEEYIINDCSAYAPNGDLQQPANKFVMEMAQKYGDKILISDDSHFVKPEEKIVQDVKLLQGGSWRFATSYHRFSNEEAWKYFNGVMGIDEKTFTGWVENSWEWVEQFKNFKFKSRASLPTKFYPSDTLRHTMHLIQKQGRQSILTDPAHRERLRAEIELLHRNGTIDLLPYFFIDEEAVSQYVDKGRLTGPGRGSAAGLELCYLLGITHTDPLRWDLSMDRFITKDRIAGGKMPDIDQDLPDRDILVDPKDPNKGWLRERFGDCVAQISTDTTIRVKSAVLDVHRIRSPDRRVPEEVSKLAHRFAQVPQGISDHNHVFGYDNNGEQVPGAVEWDEALAEYVKRYPVEWDIVQKCLGITRGKSVHACAFLISNEPIHNWIPLTSVNGVTVTQPTAAGVEASGGLKMDFLIVSSLNDIEAAIKLVQQRHGDTKLPWSDPKQRVTINNIRVPMVQVIPHKDQFLDVWDLPEDQGVFRDICESKTESVFQFGSEGAQKWLRYFNQVRFTDPKGEIHKGIDSIESLSVFNALNRKGPLGANLVLDDGKSSVNMLVEFSRRAMGKKPAGSAPPILMELLPETHGVIVYQEQLTKIYRVLGQTSGPDADEFRIHISKKQTEKVIADKLVFMPGATARLGVETAEQIWGMMETFAQYGFNKSHAICYSILGYACAWLKHHYPLEWWTAVLRTAGKDEIITRFWGQCGHLIDLPDISLSTDRFDIVNERIRAPLNMMKGVGPAAHEEITKLQPLKDIEDFCRKIEDRRVREGTSKEVVLKTKTKIVVSKARTALHQGLVCTLIASGSMDSLFPPEMTLLEKLERYVVLNCTISDNVYKTKGREGEPKETVPEKYLSLNAIQQYQMRKQILPAFCADLLKLIVPEVHRGYHTRPGSWRYKYKGRKGDAELVVPNVGEIQRIGAISPWLNRHTLRLATPAYVISYEKRTWQGNQQYAKVMLDVNGYRLDLAVWCERNGDGKPPEHLRGDLTGAVVTAVLAKYNDKRPFVIDDLIVIQPPLAAVPVTPPPTPPTPTEGAPT